MLPRQYKPIYTALIMAGAVLASALTFAHGAPVQAAPPVAAAPADLSAYRGKVVYLDFWASWCGPCKLSFPFMESLRNRYGAQGLVVLTVNVDHDRAAAERFLHETGSTLPVIYDPQGVLAARYKVAGMPTTVLIGRDGGQRQVHRGFFPAKTGEYEQHVNGLLAEHP